MAIVNLSAPWIEHYRKLQTMFANDPDVSVVYDSACMVCEIYAEGEKRAEALEKLLKPSVQFGNVVLNITVHQVNGISEKYGRFLPLTLRNGLYAHRKDDLHYQALLTNPAVNSIEYTYGPGKEVLTYVIFTPEVAQYFSDDIGDYYGLKSTLYEDIARDIFVEEFGVFYCTNRVREKEG